MGLSSFRGTLQRRGGSAPLLRVHIDVARGIFLLRRHRLAEVSLDRDTRYMRHRLFGDCRGSEKEKVEPYPSVLSTHNLPP